MSATRTWRRVVSVCLAGAAVWTVSAFAGADEQAPAGAETCSVGCQCGCGPVPESKAKGAQAEGAEAKGAQAEGAEAKGAEAKGAKAEGAEAEGAEKKESEVQVPPHAVPASAWDTISDHVDKGRIESIELDADEQGRHYFDVEFVTPGGDRYEVEVEIDGRLLKLELED